MKRRKIKMSTFGSFAEVRRVNNCDHIWLYNPVEWWGYMKADYQCVLCGTWKRGEK